MPLFLRSLVRFRGGVAGSKLSLCPFWDANTGVRTQTGPLRAAAVRTFWSEYLRDLRREVTGLSRREHNRGGVYCSATLDGYLRASGTGQDLEHVHLPAFRNAI